MEYLETESPPLRDGATGQRPRAAGRGDLAAINALIARAVDTWDLSARVKRSSIPLYQYHPVDFDFLSMLVAPDGGERIAGVAAWEAVDACQAPLGGRAALLHGIYVDPGRTGRGIGSLLLECALDWARAQAGPDGARAAGYDGLLVRAQADAVGFFESCGLARLAAADPLADYPHRYWLDLNAGDKRTAA